MSILVYAFAAIAIMGMIGTGVYKVKEWGADEVRQEWAAANLKAKAESEARISKAADDLAAERKKRKIVIREVTTYVDKIVDRPVYRTVCLDDDGLRCLDSAIRGESTAGCKPDGRMPDATAPDGKGR